MNPLDLCRSPAVRVAGDYPGTSLSVANIELTWKF
jgi:hypothetical protein